MSGNPDGRVGGLLHRHAQPAIAGTIVCGAVIASSGGKGLDIGDLSLTVLATSLVYWIAHIYTDTLAVVATRHESLAMAARAAMSHTWFLAAISLIPLMVLVVLGLLGAQTQTAAYAALVATTLLLATYGAMAGRRGGLSAVGTCLAALGGGGLGLLLIGVKAFF